MFGALSCQLLLLLMLDWISSTKGNDVRMEKQKIVDVMNNYMKEKEFSGYQLGLLAGSQLVFVHSQGEINENTRLRPHSLLPVLDLSKTITAVAILKLAEDGVISLNETIFTENGLLYDFVYAQPNLVSDPRIYNITIEHLLTHTGGWDEVHSEVSDPMMNPLLSSLGYTVPNIREAMGLESDLDHYSIIDYMVTQQLDFTPGTMAVHSNFGYCLLGRVIEAATGNRYENHIKDVILTEAGMMHTRILDSTADLKEFVLPKYDANAGKNSSKLLKPQYLDSTLGWSSNVYDVAKFFIALFEKQIFLSKPTLEYGLLNIPELKRRRHKGWFGLAMTIHKNGKVIQESRSIPYGINVFIQRKKHSPMINDAQNKDDSKEEFKTVIFLGKTNKPLKHNQRFMDTLLNISFASFNDDPMLKQIADFSVKTEFTSVHIANKLKHNHIRIFSNAIKIAGFYPLWIQGYSYGSDSYFNVIFTKVIADYQSKYKVFASKSKSKILQFLSKNAGKGYQISLVQNFVSNSHNQKILNLVLLRQPLHPELTMFNFKEPYTTFKQTLPYHEAAEYKVTTLSTTQGAGETYVSYILSKQHSKTLHFTGVTMQQAEVKVTEASQHKYFLSYVDCYTDGNGSHLLSMVLSETEIVPRSFLFQTDLIESDFIVTASQMAIAGYLPKFVLYYSKENELYVLVYWEKL